METTLIYIRNGNSYLMLHRVKKENDINRDKWIGIGGHFLADETPVECALREAYEETGLTLKELDYRGIVTFISDQNDEAEHMHLFTSDCYDGELKQCDEGDLMWIDKNEVLSLAIWEGDRIFLKLLDEDNSFFSLKLEYRGNDLVFSKIDYIK